MLKNLVKVASVFIVVTSSIFAAGNVYSGNGGLNIGKPQFDVHAATADGTIRSVIMPQGGTTTTLSQQNTSIAKENRQVSAPDAGTKVERDFYRVR